MAGGLSIIGLFYMVHFDIDKFYEICIIALSHMIC